MMHKSAAYSQERKRAVGKRLKQPRSDRAIEKTDGTSRCQAHRSAIKVMRTVIVMTREREIRQPVGQNMSGETSSSLFFGGTVLIEAAFSLLLHARSGNDLLRSLEGGFRQPRLHRRRITRARYFRRRPSRRDSAARLHPRASRD